MKISSRLRAAACLAAIMSGAAAVNAADSRITFGIVSPAGGMEPAAFDAGLTALKRCGFAFKIFPHAREKRGYLSSPAETRASDLAAAWNDEAHVRANRDLYREKYDAVLDILGGVLISAALLALFAALLDRIPVTERKKGRHER